MQEDFKLYSCIANRVIELDYCRKDRIYKITTITSLLNLMPEDDMVTISEKVL